MVGENVLPELVKLPVVCAVGRDHVEVPARVVLVPRRAHQVREWVVQDRLRRDERELV